MKEILFQSYQLNAQLRLSNRIVMAPMTRNKADDKLIPTLEMAEYYGRRASAGMIITEGIIIRPDGRGYSNVPGIFTKAQVLGWRKVVDKVHEQGGLIFAQLWHVGRVSHPFFLNGALPISPSSTQMTGEVKRSPLPGLHYGQARALTVVEIKDLIKSYRLATKNALRASFDGIELHGANGYLIDQFLHYHTNQRSDLYGGSAASMARFLLEIIYACSEEIELQRIGIRLSPGAYLNEVIGEKQDKYVFLYLLDQLNAIPIAYVHTGNFDDSKKFTELNNLTMTAFLRKYYQNKLIACGGYDINTASSGIAHHDFDLVAFGKPFIANPDLIYLCQNKLPLKTYDAAMLNQLY